MSERSTKPLIPSRVMAIGNEMVPKEIIEALLDHQLHAFMREPDPNDWPPDMEHLIAYLSGEEQLRVAIARVLIGHDEMLLSSLEDWTRSVWNELTAEKRVCAADASIVVDEMLQHLKLLVATSLKRADSAIQ